MENWISVDDQLPVTSDRYLVTMMAGPFITVAIRKYRLKTGWGTPMLVTHWMDRPEPAIFDGQKMIKV